MVCARVARCKSAALLIEPARAEPYEVTTIKREGESVRKQSRGATESRVRQGRRTQDGGGGVVQCGAKVSGGECRRPPAAERLDKGREMRVRAAP